MQWGGTKNPYWNWQPEVGRKWVLTSCRGRWAGRRWAWGPSCNHLPTHACLLWTSPAGWVVWYWAGTDKFYTSCLFLSFPLPPPQKWQGRRKLDHLGLGRLSGREKVLDSDSTWEARLHLAVSKDWLKQHRQGPFMEVSILLQECAFGNFDSTAFSRIYGSFVRSQSLSVPLLPHPYTWCHSVNIRETFDFWVEPRHPDFSTFFSLKLTYPL